MKQVKTGKWVQHKFNNTRPEIEYSKVGKKHCATFNLPDIAASCEVKVYADTRKQLDSKVDSFFNPAHPEK